MRRWRFAAFVLLIMIGSLMLPVALPALASTPEVDAHSVVPVEFRDDMTWSEHPGWHWVVDSYTGINVTEPVTIESPYFVAARVRTLAPDDPCTDCVTLADHKQGPPIIFGGPANPRLAEAYASLDNGPRFQLAPSEEIPHGQWAAGVWFLNYNPEDDRFFSWTWIPEPDQEMLMEPVALLSQSQPQFLAGIPDGSRVFPMAPGTYRVTQPFGCVPFDPGYATPDFCPPDRPSFHAGVDFGAPEGVTIYASASGKVTFADIDPSNASGNSMIVIQHDGPNADYRTVYLHWRRSYVTVGDDVLAGQPIAENGSVGYSTGPHLHFAVKEVANGAAVDPMVWLQASAAPMTIAVSVENVTVGNVLRWESFIRASSERHNVPTALIAAIMTIESSGNPNVVSPAGAQGLMQVMPMHLERYGIPPERWLDPATNIDAGARYLGELLAAGNTLQQAAARYFGIGCDVLGTCTDQYVSVVWSWHSYYVALFAGNPLPPIVQAPVVQTINTQPSPPSNPDTGTIVDEPGTAPDADEQLDDPETGDEPTDGAEHDVTADPDAHQDDPDATAPDDSDSGADDAESDENSIQQDERMLDHVDIVVVGLFLLGGGVMATAAAEWGSNSNIQFRPRSSAAQTTTSASGRSTPTARSTRDHPDRAPASGTRNRVSPA